MSRSACSGRISDLFEILEMAVRVSRFSLGGRAEYRRNIVVTLNIRLLSEVEVTTVRLAFTGESSLEILLGL